MAADNASSIAVAERLCMTPLRQDTLHCKSVVVTRSAVERESLSAGRRTPGTGRRSGGPDAGIVQFHPSSPPTWRPAAYCGSSGNGSELTERQRTGEVPR